MNKEFIPYELALSLKQLGFDEPCLFYYYGSNDLQSLIQIDMPRLVNHNESILGTCYSAPSYSQAFRWFREKHNLKSCIMFRTSMADNEEYYDWLIKGQEVVYRHFKTYEEAELACLVALIKIVKK